MAQGNEAGFDLNNCSHRVKIDLAEMLKGGLIVDVSDSEQARVAEAVGAIAVVAAEPFREGGSMSKMSDPELIKCIQEAVTIPVIAKCRIGHSTEAQILEALFVDFIDESEELPPADLNYYIDKHSYKIPFVCGCRDLGDALRRIAEGAALLKVCGSESSDDLSALVQNIRAICRQIRYLSTMDRSELMLEARRMGAPYSLIQQVADAGQLPIPLFSGGAIATYADAALMMQLGAQSVFVNNSVFYKKDYLLTLQAMAAAVAHYDDPEMLSKISKGQLSEMPEVDLSLSENDEALLQRGW